jgi:Ca2+-binding RTX toxin-like protein
MSRLWRVLALGVALATVCVSPARASTYDNPTALSLPSGNGPSDDFLPASTYPSTITVAGLPGGVVGATATVRGISHAFPGDIDALLVAPSGAKSILFSDVCGDGLVGAVDLTLDDAASTTVPLGGAGPCQSGTYRPTDGETGADPFPVPAPPGPYAAAMSAFAGTDPNGVWQLFVMDDDFSGSGAVGRGWTLELLPDARCTGKPPSRAANVGTAGPDVLTGTPGPDIMLGLAGKDRILGLAGNDVICGGAGNDKVLGGPGKDLLRGEGGRDGLKGQGGKDTCAGGGKPDTARSCEKQKSI